MKKFSCTDALRKSQRSCRYQIQDDTNNITKADTKRQSETLQKVELTVSAHPYKHSKMFGTLVEGKKDPCSGDSGGPLMYKDEESGRWVIIGLFWLNL